MHRSLLPIAHITARQYSLVTRAQAIRAGISTTTLQRCIDDGVLDVVHPTVYRPAGAPITWKQRCFAAVLAAGPGAALSHRSAAALWKLCDDVEQVEITVPFPRLPRLKGVTVHRSRDVGRANLTRRKGIPVTNPLRTVVDLGAVAGELVGDAVELGLIAGLFSVLALEAEVDRLSQKGRFGIGPLRRYLDDRALGDQRPDGLLEPRMARLMRKYDLPPATFQYRVKDGQGRFVARVDFAYPELKIAIEVDGWEKRAKPERMDADHARQARLAGRGWVVVRFSWNQIVRRPAWVAAQLRSVLCARATTCRS